MSIAIVSLAFAEMLWLAQGKLQSWSFYLTVWEVGFEVTLRLVFAALAGMALGTICTAVLSPILWYFVSSRERLIDWVTKFVVVLVLFVYSRYAVIALINKFWSYHGPRFRLALLTAHFLAFSLALCIPRVRQELVTSLDGFLGTNTTRRLAIATVVGTVALVATEFALVKTALTVNAAHVSRRPKSNVLLITFDALSAEDMSLYGYTLPTTPNIDAFARKATVFTSFYSASTFTTPSVATILTGLYPSESQVYQLQGHVRPQNSDKGFARAMRSAGYATGAFFSNPFAYYVANSLPNDYDFMPEPIFQSGSLQRMWDATRPLHQDSGFGSRVDEYWDLEHVWNTVGRMNTQLSMRFPAVASFEQAHQILEKLPDGFFLWIHVMTPHSPYLPDSANRGRFLAASALPGLTEEPDSLWEPHYQPDQQSQVDEHRLRYDEFIATADRAFGDFMSELEASGKLKNTTVIVSADHGESFEGGVYQHHTPYLTRPVIHVPLIIRTPGQQDGRTVAFTADQTALAPTILDLASVPKPDWMRGQSLTGWLSGDGKGKNEGLAFSQYFEKNSVFKPLRHGTVGAIDGHYEYVVDIETRKGALRPLNEAQVWNLDRTADDPARAEALRAAIFSRFPYLMQNPK
jgi:arylsulfatase A-like enzyme